MTITRGVVEKPFSTFWQHRVIDYLTALFFFVLFLS